MCEIVFLLLSLMIAVAVILATYPKGERFKLRLSASSPQNSAHAQQGRNFRVVGIDKESGFEIEQVVHAGSAATAKAKAEFEGVIVTSCVPIRRATPKKSTISRGQRGFILVMVAIGVVLNIAYITTPDPWAPSRDQPAKVSQLQKEWYMGGTLHSATMREWSAASEANQLATCADIVSARMLDEGRTDGRIDRNREVKPLAEVLMSCINTAGAGRTIDHQTVSEVATRCYETME